MDDVSDLTEAAERLRNIYQRFAEEMGVLDPHRKKFVESLPAISEDDLVRLNEKDSVCPICFTPFLAVLASEELAQAMESPAIATQDLGVTRLADACGHLFCRKDISTWILQSDNNSCPTCRRPLLPIRPGANGLDTPPVAWEGSGFINPVDVLLGTSGFRMRRASENVPQAEIHAAPPSATVHESVNSEDAPQDERRDEYIGLYS